MCHTMLASGCLDVRRFMIRSSLVAKLALVVLLAVGIGFAVASVVSTQIQLESLERLHERNARSISRSVSAGVRNAMLSGKGITVEQMLGEVRRELEGAQVRVFSPRGEEVFTPAHAETEQPVPSYVRAVLDTGVPQQHDTARAYPIDNRAPCHRCHDGNERFRGVLTLGLEEASLTVDAGDPGARALASVVHEGFVQIMSAEAIGGLDPYFEDIARRTPGLVATAVFDGEGDAIFGAMDTLGELEGTPALAGALAPNAATSLHPRGDTLDVLIPMPNEARCRNCHADSEGPRGVLAVRLAPALLQAERTVLESARVSLDHVMLAGLGRLIKNQLDALAVSGLVKTLTLHDASGQLFHDIQPRTAQTPQRVLEVLERGEDVVTREETEDSSTFLYIEALENEQRCQSCHGSEAELRGVIEVRLDTTSDRVERDSIEKRSILFGIGTILLVVGLLYAGLRWTVLKPVRSISQVAEKVGAGDLHAQVQVRSRDEIGQLGHRINEMVVGLRHKLELSKFVSRETLKEVEREGDDVAERRGKRQELAVLFSDIRGFTAFSETREPEEVVEMLNLYLQLQADIVTRYGGDIDKFVGDELMARFDGNDKAGRATRAAIEMMEAVERANRERADLDYNVAIGVGINLDDMVLGAMGAEHRMDFTVIGDGVNLGARLCSAAQPGQVLISQSVRDAIANDDADLRIDTLEPITVKGKRDPIPVYNVSQRKETSS